MSDTIARWLLLLHAASTLYMVGLIWFVQIVHYPMFADVSPDAFAAYEKKHAALTTWVVGPAMLIEAAAVLWLVVDRPASLAIGQVWTGAALLAVIWLSTAFLQVPCHNELANGFNKIVHERLVSTNWIRTIGWSLRGILSFWWLVKLL